MNDPYKIALAATRFIAALNVVAGMFTLLTSVLLFALQMMLIHGPDISNWAVMILFYAILYIVIGIGFLVCARWIARFAVRALT
ncbi:MAG: hypothetical protein GC190_17200 [Alphaproteobacteria bacterium]|nr:hypothetical protein [Alphaproteobacteria bacterium]